MTAPNYTPGPRPRFEGPAHIPYAAATRHLWGDPMSGEVADWIYVSSDKIHHLVFGLPPGGAFRHSDAYRTVFAADEVLYVLSGIMVIANPETGEVHRVPAGEAVFFGPDTWHHAFNYSTEPLRVLEYFAPPPSQGTAGTYAQTRPNLLTAAYVQDDQLGRRLPGDHDAGRESTIRVVREGDRLWRIEGRDHPVLVGLLASTERLTVGQVRVLPGQHSDGQVHDGDESLYLLAGRLHVRLPEAAGQRWFELAPGDGFYIPEMVEAAARGLTVCGLGVGIAELVDPEGAITSAHTIAWQGLPVQDMLGRMAPTAIEANVRAAALAEPLFGAGRGFRLFVYVTVGTGISYSLVQDGRPFPGAHGNALVLASGPLSTTCPACGAEPDFVLEEFAAGPALVVRYNRERPGGAACGRDVTAAVSSRPAAIPLPSRWCARPAPRWAAASASW